MIFLKKEIKDGLQLLCTTNIQTKESSLATRCEFPQAALTDFDPEASYNATVIAIFAQKFKPKQRIQRWIGGGGLGTSVPGPIPFISMRYFGKAK